MAIIHHPTKLLYFLAPGTGSSALEKYFMETLHADRIPKYHEKDGVIIIDQKKTNGEALENIDPKHCVYEDLIKNQLLDEQEKQYLRVSSTRNPYDYWFAEWYRRKTRFIHLLKQPNSWIFQSKHSVNITIDSCTMDFSDWLIKLLNPKKELKQQGFLHDEFVRCSDEFVKMENMKEDLRKIIRSRGFEEDITFHVKRYNVTSRDREYWRNYSDEARKLIAYLYEPHFDKFKYVF